MNTTSKPLRQNSPNKIQYFNVLLCVVSLMCALSDCGKIFVGFSRYLLLDKASKSAAVFCTTYFELLIMELKFLSHSITSITSFLITQKNTVSLILLILAEPVRIGWEF